MKQTKSILTLLALFLMFSCEDNSTNPIEEDVIETCGNSYQEWSNGVSCDEGCELIEGKCYYSKDLQFLSDLQDSNETLSEVDILQIGVQYWRGYYMSGDIYGRIVEFHYNSYEETIPNLTSIPESIRNLTGLKSLELYSNPLTTFPESILRIDNLEELILYNNQFTSLSDSIGDLSNLKKLIISNNQLTSLPESIGDLSNLEEL